MWNNNVKLTSFQYMGCLQVNIGILCVRLENKIKFTLAICIVLKFLDSSHEQMMR